MVRKDTLGYIQRIRDKIEDDFQKIFQTLNAAVLEDYEISGIAIYENGDDLVVTKNGSADEEIRFGIESVISPKLLDTLRTNADISLVNIRRDMNPLLWKENKDSEKIKKVIGEIFSEKQYYAIISDLCILGGVMVYYIISINREFYESNQSMFCVDNPLFEDSYRSIVMQVTDILFDRWLAFAYYGYEESAADYLQNTEAIVNLAAEDMTSGRGIPSYRNFIRWSSLTYERSYCYGKVAICENQDKLKNMVEFTYPIELSPKNDRYIRKLLELAGDDYYLLVTSRGCGVSERIWGLGEIRDLSGIHTVSFGGYMKWTLCYGEKELFSFDRGNFVYQENKKSDKKLMSILEELEFDQEKISKIIDCAIKQHGALLIFSKYAEQEMSRLSGLDRGIKMKAVDLYKNSSVVLKLSSVDGAIMADGEGTAYGFAAILDGTAVANGDNSRGSRYNSAKNYVELCNRAGKVCFACVVSEDGNIDFLN